MTNYESLGIRPIINATATLTRLGGSLMAPEVLQAMNEAARSFIDLHELQRRVGDRLAEITHNEAAYVSCGAAAGLVLAAASCIAGTDSDLIRSFPHLDGMKNEIIVHATHRNGYDYALREIGAQIVEIGSAEGTSRADLEQAITPRTAAFFWFQGAMTTPNDLPLREVIEIANAHGIPVIVDAAAQLPPVSNLWTFTQMGAALAVFSGGKDLRGPQSSGLVLGRRDLVEACRIHGSPNANVGRPMKVGKEEMMGLLAAVERYLTLDHDAREQVCESTVAMWIDTLSAIPGISARRTFPNEAGQPLPRCLLTIDAAQLGMDAKAVQDQLASGDPSIVVELVGADGIHLNPMTLEAGEADVITNRLQEIVASRVSR
ncbi:MAG: aminotransferase class V-fold PLP-dependent enzyme [Chloroflexi bacterium]|nr:aminotransferase class V-fold PLP-dependent enzyme [Chloroflexota bacterium]